MPSMMIDSEKENLMKKEKIVKKMISMSDRELSEVSGGLTTFPDQDGVDRHSWFVTLLMNLLRGGKDSPEKPEGNKP